MYDLAKIVFGNNSSIYSKQISLISILKIDKYNKC